MAQIMSQQLDAMPFPPGGPYTMLTYNWESQVLGENGSDITLNPTMQILFNNKTEQGLIGFAFQSYAPKLGKSFANGVAIVYNTSGLLDNYSASGTNLEIEYNVPGMGRTLRSSKITAKETVIDKIGRQLAVYSFNSEDA
jgi:hypothetical protein